MYIIWKITLWHYYSSIGENTLLGESVDKEDVSVCVMFYNQLPFAGRFPSLPVARFHLFMPINLSIIVRGVDIRVSFVSIAILLKVLRHVNQCLVFTFILHVCVHITILYCVPNEKLASSHCFPFILWPR